MDHASRNLIVVGQGAAGVAAALAATETAPARNSPIKITVVDKANENEAGGNTRWSPSYMRMASLDAGGAGICRRHVKATRAQGDEAYFLAAGGGSAGEQ